MAKKIIELSDPKLRSLLANQIDNALGYLGGQLSNLNSVNVDLNRNVKLYQL